MPTQRVMAFTRLVVSTTLALVSGHAPAPRITPSRPYAPPGNPEATAKPLVVLPMLYGAAAAQIASAALVAPGASRAAFATTALALAVDFGPSAVRDASSTIEAQAVNVDAVMAAAPTQILIDNFVHNLGPKDEEKAAAKAEAMQRLTDVNAWSALVRFRIAADALGVWLLLRGVGSLLGAAVIFAAHAMYWSSGGASTRVDRFGNPSPLSPPLAKLVAIVAATLAGLAAAASLGPWGATLSSTLAGWAYSAVLLVIEAARIVADRVRNRVHVGI